MSKIYFTYNFIGRNLSQKEVQVLQSFKNWRPASAVIQALLHLTTQYCFTFAHYS